MLSASFANIILYSQTYEKQATILANFNTFCRADEQERSVTIEADKIGKEEAATKIIADQAQADLDKAIPALESAAAALDSLKKKDSDEIKAYAKPPPAGTFYCNSSLTTQID